MPDHARARANRIARALLENVDIWIQTTLDVADKALPGNKVTLLHLAHNMMQCRGAIERLLLDELLLPDDPRKPPATED